MHPMAHIPMQDKDMLCDSLASQKEITGIYNTFSNECVSTPLRNELLNILHDEHSIGADILSEMQKEDGGVRRAGAGSIGDCSRTSGPVSPVCKKSSEGSPRGRRARFRKGR